MASYRCRLLLALINGGGQLVCAENSGLYLRGDAAACIYIVIEGQLASFGEWQSEQVLLHRHFAGDVLGYVLFDEQAQRSATVASVSQAVLLEIPVSVVDALFAQIPGAIKGQIQEDPTMFRLRLALRLSELFKGLDETEFRALESLLAVTSASCGTVLCFQGDPSDRLFIIVSGRMQVSVTDLHQNVKVVGEVALGDTVGELGVITGKPRAATVTLIRDSSYASLSFEAYQHLLRLYPIAINQVFTHSIVQHFDGARQRRQRSSAIALVPLSGSLSIAEVAQGLTRAFGQYAQAKMLRYQADDENRPLYDLFQSGNQGSLMQWLTEQEQQYAQLVYVASEQADEWSRWCVRQADIIIWVADITQDAAVGAMEQQLLVERGEGKPAYFIAGPWSVVNWRFQSTLVKSAQYSAAFSFQCGATGRS